MKRILEVFGEPISRGGQESYVMSALQNINCDELHIDLFTPYFCNNKIYENYISKKGGSIFVGNLKFEVGGTRREILPVFDEFLKKNKYDIIHIHSGSISVLAYYSKIASKSGADKVIVHSHSSGDKENLKHWLIKKYATLYFNKYPTDFCACSYEAAFWKFPKNKLKQVIILQNGVDLERFSFNEETRRNMRIKFNIKENTLVLGHVGRFTKEKNQTYLIDVLDKYIKKYSDNVKLILVGDGEELQSTKRKTQSYGLEDKVIFAGAKDNVPDFLQMFDIFLFPSLYEGLGIVAIEAQAVGLPVIASTGVPKSIMASSDVNFCELSNIENWINLINKWKKYKRNKTNANLKEEGYDVKDTSKAIYELYTK